MLTDHEPLTDDERQIAFELWAARMFGLAGAVKPEFYPAAHALCERGWLSRRIQDDDVIWEFTDLGLAALDLNALTESVKGRQN